MGCEVTSTGKTPLIDFTPTQTYNGFAGLLYPGRNTPPNAHRARALAAAAAVTRLDANGDYDKASGLIGLLSLGMSNTNQEWDRFEEIYDGTAPYPNSHIVTANGAVGGIGASAMDEDYFTTVDGRVTAAGLTNEQVQWIWFKTAEPDEDGSFPTHAQTLQASIKAAVLLAVDRYPNLKGISFSSRIYDGYAEPAPTSPSPHPYGYEGAWAFKWLIESQIDGSDTDLAYDTLGVWLGWGPYIWADGTTANSEGLSYECADFEQGDKTHPAAGAEQKVADKLVDYFEGSEWTQPWYIGSSVKVYSLGSVSDNTDQAEYTLSITPTAGRLVMVFLYNRLQGSTADTPSLSGNNLTWELVRGFNFGTSSQNRMSLIRAMGSAPSSGNLTVTFPQAQSACSLSVLEFTDASADGTNGSAAVAQSAENSGTGVSALTVTLETTPAAGSVVVAGFAYGATTNMTPETGWTLAHAVSSSGQAVRLMTMFETTPDQTATATPNSGTHNMGGIAVEIRPQTRISRPVRASRPIQIPAIAQLRI